MENRMLSISCQGILQYYNCSFDMKKFGEALNYEVVVAKAKSNSGLNHIKIAKVFIDK